MPMPVAGRLGRASRFLVEYDYRDGLDVNGLPIFRSGQIPSYVRGGTVNTATAVDRKGVINIAGPTLPCFHHRYNATTGLFEPVGLILDEGGGNLFANSNSLSADTGTTVTSAVATGPDGKTSAQRISKTDATTPRYTIQNTTLTVAAATTYTVYRHFKYDGYDTTVSLEYNNGNDFNLSWYAYLAVASSGVTVSSVNLCTARVTRLGDGWYRVAVTFTTGAAPTGVNPSVLTRITGASGVTVQTFGGQFKLGATECEYIPTSGSVLTRAAEAFDAPFNVPASALKQTGVTIYEDFTLTAKDLGDTAVMMIGHPGIGGVNCIGTERNGGAPNQFLAKIVAATATSQSASAPAVSLNDRIERLTTVDPNTGAIQLSVAVNGGTPLVGAKGAAGGWPAAFTNARAYFTDEATAARKGGMIRRFVRVAPSVQSFDSMRQGN